MSMIDLGIVVVYIAAILVMSIMVGKTNKSQEDYFIGGRSMPWLPVACSIAASTISANGLIGGPGWAYTGGFSAFMLQFSVPLVMIIACNFVVPFMYNLKVTSSYEYIEMRFGKASHLLSCLGYLYVALTLLSGFVYIPSLIIQQLTGWSLTIIVPIIILAVIAYTMIGGIKAVIWTDAIQMVVLWVGIIAICIIPFATSDLTFGDMFKTAGEAGLLNALDFSFDLALENGFWVALFGGAAMWLQYFAADQTQLQRMLSAKSVRAAKSSICTGGILMNVMMFVFCVIGLVMYSFFQAGEFASANDIMITFVLEHLPVGLVGLMIAAVFAAAMSSIDSVLNSMTTVFVKDIYEQYIKKGEETPLRVTVGFTGVFGVIAAILVLMSFSGTTASVLATVGALSGYVAGSLLAVFILALWCEKANNIGTSVGFIVGVIATWWVAGNTTLNWLWWYLVGVVVACVVGYVVSLFTAKDDIDISELTIAGQRKALIAKGTTEEDGASILPGTMDKYGWILLGFFVIQFAVLFLFTK